MEGMGEGKEEGPLFFTIFLSIEEMGKGMIRFWSFGELGFVLEEYYYVHTYIPTYLPPYIHTPIQNPRILFQGRCTAIILEILLLSFPTSHTSPKSNAHG